MRAIGICIAAILGGDPELAPVGPDIVLSLETCVGVDEEVARKLIGIELSAALGAAEPRAIPIEVSARCGPEGVEVQVKDPSAARQDGLATRTLRLALVDPPARTRLFALGVAEIIVGNRRDPLPAPAAASAPLPAPRSSPELAGLRDRSPPTNVRRPPHLAVRLGAIVPARELTLGPALAVTADFPFTRGGRGRIAGDLLLLNSSRAHDLGRVEAQALGGAVGVRGVLPLGRASVHAETGARLAIARLSGVPDDPARVIGRSFTALWGGPRVQVGADLRWGTLRVGLVAEAGLAILRLQGRVLDDTATRWEGLWLLTAVQVGADL